MSPFGTMSTAIVVVLGRLSVVCVLVWVVVVLKEVVVGTISSEISHVLTDKYSNNSRRDRTRRI